MFSHITVDVRMLAMASRNLQKGVRLASKSDNDSAGSIGKAGGTFGKKQQAQEGQYFKKLQQDQLKKLKQRQKEHEEEIKKHQEEMEKEKKMIEELEKNK